MGLTRRLCSVQLFFSQALARPSRPDSTSLSSRTPHRVESDPSPTPPRPDSTSLSSRTPDRVESDPYVPVLLGVYKPPRIFDTPYEEITRGGAASPDDSATFQATPDNSAAGGNVQQQHKVRCISVPQHRPGRPPVRSRVRH